MVMKAMLFLEYLAGSGMEKIEKPQKKKKLIHLYNIHV